MFEGSIYIFAAYSIRDQLWSNLQAFMFQNIATRNEGKFSTVFQPYIMNKNTEIAQVISINFSK